jgi:hypothetical protein
LLATFQRDGYTTIESALDAEALQP